MNYIVIDLEWNQSPLGRGTEEKNLPFEIIEIGAVKLNSNREIVDEFRQLIKPQVYHEIHSKTKEIIQMDMEDLNQGLSFDKVVTSFFEWCGTDYQFCTWGPMDLTELQRNLDYYHLSSYMNKPMKYYDIQKLFAINYEGEKNPRTLEYAINYLNIRSDEEFHKALFDAKYTVKVFQTLDMNIVNQYYSIDFYHNPKTKEEEILLVFDKYSKYISMEYEHKEDVLANKDVKDMVCYLCKKRAAKKIKWFSNNSKNYYCVAMCKEHGYLKGKIRIKKASSGKYFAVKTIKLISAESADIIRSKQEEINNKKKLKKLIKKRSQEVE